MTLLDVFLLPLFIVVILITAFIIRETVYKHHVGRKYILAGLGFKILGALFFCAIYAFYYGGLGDAFVYHESTVALSEAIEDSPKLGLELWATEANTYDLRLSELSDKIPYYSGENTYMVVRIATVLGFLCGNSFWVLNLLFATLSFMGLWLLYTVFVDVYPKAKDTMAMAVFFVPSVFFWGSGLLKDTVTMGCVGGFTYGVYHLLIKRDRILVSIFLIWICSLLIDAIKGYILWAFFIPTAYWLFFHYREVARRQNLKIFFNVCMLSAVALGVYFLSDRVADIGYYMLGKFVGMAMDFQSWHGYLSNEGQTGYTLGEIEFSIPGILSKFPASVNVALFRPYLSEVNNPVMLIAALEGTAFMAVTLYVFFKVGFFRSLKIAFGTPFISFCLLYALFFAFAVGFATYNFGALVRYKIPCLPFYIGAVFMVLEQYRIESSSSNTKFTIQ
ncbi:MAG: hypothetical protein R3E32_25885 [Chitinophagales bacterium]